MSGMERFDGWLSCPECERDLEISGADTVGCSSGHRFEVGRRGYLGLAAAGRHITGPRDDVGAASHSRPRGTFIAPAESDLQSAIIALIARERRVLDIRPRPGMIAAVRSAVRPTTALCALSDSPRVLTEATAVADVAGVLADASWRWPLREAAATALIAIDAPRFGAEFHRVLAPGGSLVLAPHDPEVSQLVDDLSPWFEHDQSRPVPGMDRVAVRLRRRRRMISW